MTLTGTARRPRWALFLLALLTAIVLAVAFRTGTAQASNECGSYEGGGSYCLTSGNLPKGAWTSDGAVGNLFEVYLHHSWPGSGCVGPVQYSGGKWVFPYGWKCSTEATVYWEFSTISAAGAIYNAGSAEGSYWFYSFYH